MKVAGWRRRCGEGKKQTDTVGAPQIEVVADDLLEEVPTLDRAIEDLSEADLRLPEREAMLAASGAISEAQRPGQSAGPAVEERLQVLGSELVAELLHSLRLAPREEAVVPGLVADALAPQPSLDPLVTVGAELDRGGDVGSGVVRRRADSRVELRLRMAERIEAVLEEGFADPLGGEA